MHFDLSLDWLNVVFNTVCKDGSWMPVFSVSTYLIRFSLGCNIGKYPYLLGALFSQNWVFLVPLEIPLTFIDLHEDVPWLAQHMALCRWLYNFCEYIIQITSDTENWRRELKSRLTWLSFLGKEFSRQEQPPPTCWFLAFSLPHLSSFFVAFVVFLPLSSVLSPHASSLYFCNIDASPWLGCGFIEAVALRFPIFPSMLPTLIIFFLRSLSYHFFDFIFFHDSNFLQAIKTLRLMFSYITWG